MDIQDGLTQIPEYAVAADRERAVEFFQPEPLAKTVFPESLFRFDDRELRPCQLYEERP